VTGDFEKASLRARRLLQCRARRARSGALHLPGYRSSSAMGLLARRPPNHSPLMNLCIRTIASLRFSMLVA
jgi:hypothetical protein